MGLRWGQKKPFGKARQVVLNYRPRWVQGGTKNKVVWGLQPPRMRGWRAWGVVSLKEAKRTTERVDFLLLESREEGQGQAVTAVPRAGGLRPGGGEPGARSWGRPRG